MNCFEWQNRSSDYMDGALIGAIQQEADQHLESCPSCSVKFGHYRTIISTLSNQPRAQLPIPVRKAPLTVNLPRLELSTSRWTAIPWYIRTSIEAAGIILVTLLGITLGPKARALYELKIERSLNDFSQAFIESTKTDGSASADANQATQIGLENSPPADEFSSEGEEEEAESDSSAPADEEKIKVGKSDVWRFILKTDSPAEMRSKIIVLLTALKGAGDTSKTEGTRAPGGIQFDLTLPQTAIPKLKTQLTELAPPAPEGLAETPAGETFTWYKVKSKRRLPDGKTRVVIWISQI